MTDDEFREALIRAMASAVNCWMYGFFTAGAAISRAVVHGRITPEMFDT